jgi:hypothetical protein
MSSLWLSPSSRKMAAALGVGVDGLAFDVAVRDLPHDGAGVERLGGGGDQACDVRAVDH